MLKYKWSEHFYTQNLKINEYKQKHEKQSFFVDMTQQYSRKVFRMKCLNLQNWTNIYNVDENRSMKHVPFRSCDFFFRFSFSHYFDFKKLVLIKNSIIFIRSTTCSKVSKTIFVMLSSTKSIIYFWKFTSEDGSQNIIRIYFQCVQSCIGVCVCACLCSWKYFPHLFLTVYKRNEIFFH